MIVNIVYRTFYFNLRRFTPERESVNDSFSFCLQTHFFLLSFPLKAVITAPLSTVSHVFGKRLKAKVEQKKKKKRTEMLLRSNKDLSPDIAQM